MTKEEIIEMAFKAGVEDSNEYNHLVCTEVELVAFAKLVAEKAIKEALAHPEQEPVAWEQFYPDIGKPKFVAQPKQEPVAWMDEDGDVLSASVVSGKGLRNIPLYTTPPQRKPLTGWQPIETAPRDGTEILMTNGVDVSSGQWFSEYGGTYDQEGAPNGDGCDAGWTDWSGGMQPDPTHWMPLPPPPIEPAHNIKE